MDIAALRQERGQCNQQARAILDQVEQAGRDLTAEENQEFTRLTDRADVLESQIEREEAHRERERRQVAANPEPEDQGGNGTEQQARAWRTFLRDGRAAMSEGDFRALNMGTDPEGGYLVAPQEFVEQLIQEVDDAVPLRGLATGMTLSEGESLGVPTLDTDLNDAEWTSEVGTGSQDDSLRFGKRELRPHPLAKRVLVSRTLLRRATMGPEAVVRQRMSYKHSVAREKAYMTGSGNERPLGLFVASNHGITTSRDTDVDITAADNTFVSNSASSGGTADQLINAQYTLKPQYHNRARWLFHRHVLREVRKLKDANGQYLWQPGISGGRPDTILAMPYTVSEFAPNTFTDNEYLGILGDFSFYWYVDALDMEIQRLVELYAESNQVGFIGRFEGDGMPVLEEPFVRLQANAV